MEILFMYFSLVRRLGNNRWLMWIFTDWIIIFTEKAGDDG